MTRLANAWSYFVGAGVEPHAPTTSDVVYDAPHRVLHRYSPAGVDGEPILLVPPLAVHPSCFDLRPAQSLVAHLVAETARPVYVVDFGDMGFADRHMGFEDFVDDIVPDTVARVSALHGDAPVDVVTWSLGGTITLLAAAAHPELAVRSIAAVGTPIDYSKVAYLAPLRRLGRMTGGRLVNAAAGAAGGLPSWAVRASFRVTALQRELTKPLFVLRHLDDTETLGRVEAVDRFIGLMPGYPGRFYRVLYGKAVQANQLTRGHLDLTSRRRLHLRDVTQDVLVVAGRDDVIAPPDCVRRACDVLTGTRSVRYELAPGSHLGVLTGPDARDTTWAHILDFLAAVQEPARTTQ